MKGAHPLVGLLKGENEGVHVSQVIFEKIHQLVDIGLLKLKMAIILPRGQWYAPSAVINDAWY